MRCLFHWRFMNAHCPASQQERPKRHRTRNDEQTETPASMRGMRINLFDAEQDKRDGEHQPHGQVSPQQYQEYGGDHGFKRAVMSALQIGHRTEQFLTTFPVSGAFCRASFPQNR